VPEELAALRGRVVRGVDPLLHVAARLLERLPHLARHEVGQLLLALGHQVADAAEHVAARRGRGVAPEGEAALGRGHRAVDVAAVGEGEPADHIRRISRVHVLVVLAARRLDPLAGDEVSEDFH
jgi:hypothetical protein